MDKLQTLFNAIAKGNVKNVERAAKWPWRRHLLRNANSEGVTAAHCVASSGHADCLRVIEFHHAYRGMSAKRYQIGLDGPWDIQLILGTVDVEKDGSAYFNTTAQSSHSLSGIHEVN